MHSHIKKVFFEDYVFYVWENVYEPAEDSFLFAERLAVSMNDSVLDVGTGCGILGVTAAAKAAKVVAVDINPSAVRCAKENAELNGVAVKMFFVQSDLFAPLRSEEKFDLILFNAPYVPVDVAEDDSWLGRAWAGGTSGRQIMDSFICESPKYLRRDGRVFLMQSTLSDVEETLRRFAKSGLKASVVAERALPFFETVVLVKAERLS
ncbi:MAG: methyltransferase [Candidatus Bathyarchaeota archaeon]|nr:methyltransferase [Candidatus Bathyarchaeota archaeon]MDH5787636.1 methyltransferase [Candidatus Bathyarchaeota archaeon]